ncbi:hypothetical protein LIER_07690 [Lithospermum erythrorhizon]|uniref:RING-type E3 ubiquitin transferase n=1 Tax=Lithospermum erythrorhizon TaxID=34254 RepID=A0AAV3PA30_LITER
MSTEFPRATTTPTRHLYCCIFCNYSANVPLACPSCNRLLIECFTPNYPLPTAAAVAVIQPENAVSGQNRAHVDRFDDWLAQFTSSRRKSTSKSFLESLPSITITEADLKESNSCSICMEDFGLGSLADKLPCKHLFHKSCIVEWLNRSNTCPLCRFKLPVEPRTPEKNVEPAMGVSALTNEAIRRIAVIRLGRGFGDFDTGVSGSNTTGGGRGGDFNTILDDDGDTLMIEDVAWDADGDIVMADA